MSFRSQRRREVERAAAHPRRAHRAVAPGRDGGHARADGGRRHGRPALPAVARPIWKLALRGDRVARRGAVARCARCGERRERLAWSFLALGIFATPRRSVLGHLARAARVDPVPVGRRLALPLVLSGGLRRAGAAPAGPRRPLPRRASGSTARSARPVSRRSSARSSFPRARHDRRGGDDGRHEHRLPDRRRRDARR